MGDLGLAVTGARMNARGHSDQLAKIPVVETGPAFPIETLEAERERADLLLDACTKHVPSFALRQLDVVSRQWLVRSGSVHLSEIDGVAERLGRPGAHFLSVNYEWACSCRVASDPGGQSARLVRVLDWRTPGLGRNVLAARVAGAAGEFVTLTWPGYTGVLTGMAPQRFSAALNQAPLARTTGVFVLDWARARHRVWGMRYQTPAHLLRHVFETASSFSEARDLLTSEPISTPAIFLLAGLEPDEIVVIERMELEARVFEGTNVAANHWQAHGWHGLPRGERSADRAAMMHRVSPSFDLEFSWLISPIFNARTRLAAVCDAKEGRIIAQGFEASSAATEALDLQVLR